MEHIQGKFVKAYLKGEDDIISGILIGVEHDHVYIQSHPGEDGLFIIPHDNIKYYQTSKVSFAKSQQTDDHSFQDSEQQFRQTEKALEIFINSEFLTSIPVPPTFNLETYNDDILRVLRGNPEVVAALSGRIQKSVEYYPGRVMINVIDAPEQTQPVMPRSNTGSSTFSMSGPNAPAVSFLNPSDMVARLNNIGQNKNRGNENE